MKDGILKTSDKEKVNQLEKLVIHMKVNGNKIKYMAMVFVTGQMVAC